MWSAMDAREVDFQVPGWRAASARRTSVSRSSSRRRRSRACSTSWKGAGRGRDSPTAHVLPYRPMASRPRRPSLRRPLDAHAAACQSIARASSRDRRRLSARSSTLSVDDGGLSHVVRLPLGRCRLPRNQESEKYLTSLTRNCVTCHCRSPGGRESWLRDFVRGRRPGVDRVRTRGAVATVLRRFEGSVYRDARLGARARGGHGRGGCCSRRDRRPRLLRRSSRSAACAASCSGSMARRGAFAMRLAESFRPGRGRGPQRRRRPPAAAGSSRWSAPLRSTGHRPILSWLRRPDRAQCSR